MREVYFVKNIPLGRSDIPIYRVGDDYVFDPLHLDMSRVRRGDMYVDKNIISYAKSKMRESLVILNVNESYQLDLTGLGRERLMVKVCDIKRFRDIIVSVNFRDSAHKRSQLRVATSLSEFIEVLEKENLYMNSINSNVKVDDFMENVSGEIEKIKFANGVIMDLEIKEKVQKIIQIGDIRFIESPDQDVVLVHKLDRRTDCFRFVERIFCTELNVRECKRYIADKVRVSMDIQIG